MILFLDLDGVLRRKSAPLYELEKDLVRRLESVLREHVAVRVVITSSWRHAFSLAQIRAAFSEDLRERIVGTTPTAQEPFDHPRHREVLSWLRKHAPGEPWVALDDDPEHYPSADPVILTDPARGLDEAAVGKLAGWLSGQAGPRGERGEMPG